MSLFPYEWSFLGDAWKFALVMTGRESDATALVTQALAAVQKRADLHGDERTKRVFFSILCREAARAPGKCPAPETEAERGVQFLHALPDPARQAISLLSLDIFSGENLAELLGLSKAELAECLGEARLALKPVLLPTQ